MRFGPTSIAELEGAVLAHTLHLPDGALKKGRILGRADVERIERAGLRSVVAATLDAGDLYEDAAAERLATAVTGPGLRVAPPSTGRANVFADEDGLVMVDAQTVGALNAIDPGLTLATVVSGTRARAGDLVATAKVIPLAVSKRLVEAWEAGAAGAPGLSVAPFRPHRVGLILTRVRKTPDSALTNAEATLAARVEACGSRIERTLTVAHEVEAVSEALRSLRAAELSPLLVLGASQIADPGDVVPAAVTSLGGRLHRLGIPVDPGNLLLWAELDGEPVLGVPGCARSRGRSGFDSVLEHVLAGLHFDGPLLDGLGYGGLLREVSARGQPRLGRPVRGRGSRVAGVLLAAGSSTRMGDANKLLEPVEGEPMVRRAAAVLLAAGLDPVIVVTGHERDRVRQALEGLEVRLVHNSAHQQGMSTSLVVGLDAVPRHANGPPDRTTPDGDGAPPHQTAVDGAVIALADMPWVGVDDIKALVAAFGDVGMSGICVPVHDRKRGNPVLWGAAHFGAIKALRGDVGARAILGEREDLVVEVPVERDGILRDVDTPEALDAGKENREA